MGHLLSPGIELPITSPLEETHFHRWRIDEQAGAFAAGRCECGMERAFRNGWDGDGTTQLRSATWRRTGRREPAT